MKKILLSLAAATLVFTSCHKDDDGDNVSNTWMVNGMMHTVVNTTRVGGNFVINVNDGLSTEGNGITFAFASVPTTGSYTLVDFPTRPSEVAIAINEGSVANIFRSTAAEGRKLQVRVEDNGRATLYLQGATLQSLLGTSENVEVSASVRENR